MADEGFEERTQPATAKKREEARSKSGSVAKSQDLNSAVLLLTAVLVLNVIGPDLVANLMGVIQYNIIHMGDQEMNELEAMTVFKRMGWVIFSMLLPLLIFLFVAALTVSILQVGFHISYGQFFQGVSKFNPVSGLGKIFSIRSFMKSMFGILKLLFVALVVCLTIWGERYRLLGLMSVAFESIAVYFAEIVFTVSLRAALALLILSIFDYAYQKWQYEKDLRMGKHEIKEELKRYEGDPKIRGRRRTIQRQLALQRMMQKVPQATVVVTNPTEYAVALQYREGVSDAPMVVAKGMGHIALQIRERAMEADVPIVQRPEVARALYRTTEVGQSIPQELYQAVAEILALVYRINEARAA